MAPAPRLPPEDRGYRYVMGVFESLRQLDARFVPGTRTPDPEPDYSSYWRWYRGKRLLVSLGSISLVELVFGTVATVAEWSTGGGLEPFLMTPLVGASILVITVLVGWVRYRRERTALAADPR